MYDKKYDNMTNKAWKSRAGVLYWCYIIDWPLKVKGRL
jgi:hypothetical protein